MVWIYIWLYNIAHNVVVLLISCTKQVMQFLWKCTTLPVWEWMRKWMRRFDVSAPNNDLARLIPSPMGPLHGFSSLSHLLQPNILQVPEVWVEIKPCTPPCAVIFHPIILTNALVLSVHSLACLTSIHLHHTHACA